MAMNTITWKTKGMNKDLSVSAFNPEFSFDNRNLRLSTNNDNTQMSWVNEKGTSRIKYALSNWDSTHKSTVTSIEGTPIGTAVIKDKLVIFTTTTNVIKPKKDRIYLLKYNSFAQDTLIGILLYEGNLGFSSLHPIETLISYESEEIQKVYWVDGINQPRVINICIWPYDSSNKSIYVDTSFDFVPTLQLQETVTVSKLQNGSGTFPAGVIQYSFTYFNKYGQESNIFYTSPLRFISFLDRGGAPDEKVSNAFEIKVKGLDPNFEYLRIYSILRTSLNGTPFCKKVTDLYIKGLTEISYIDTGVNGSSIDPTELFYKGGEEIIASSIEQKDGTLFLGDISIARPQLVTELQKKGYYSGNKILAQLSDGDETNTIHAPESYKYTYTGYDYFNQLNCKNSSGEYGVPCSGFKRGNTYRCGVQFQYKNGKWSEPFYIDDFKVTSEVPKLSTANQKGRIQIPRIAGTLNASITQYLKKLGYVKARALVVYPKPQDRCVICQGVGNPTLYTDNHRFTDKDIYAQSSWFFRPKFGKELNDTRGNVPYAHMDNQTVSPKSDPDDYIPYYRNKDDYNPLRDKFTSSTVNTNKLRQVEIQGSFEDNDCFKVDWDLLTFHTPDIEFDDNMLLESFANVKCRSYGYVYFSRTLSDISIQTETPPISNTGAGFVHKSTSQESSYGIVSGLFYDDYIVEDVGTDFQQLEDVHSPYKWMVYPWHRTGSLTNDVNRPANKGTRTSMLKKKIISNLRFAYSTLIVPDTGAQLSYPSNTQDIDNIQVFSSDTFSISKLKTDSNTAWAYIGNIDTLLNPKENSAFFMAFDGGYGFGSTPPDGSDYNKSGVNTKFTSNRWWKLFGKSSDTNGKEFSEAGLFHFDSESSNIKDYWGDPSLSHIGNNYKMLVVTKDSIRMKYKSTPHIVLQYKRSQMKAEPAGAIDLFHLPILEIIKEPTNIYGGTSISALKENDWVPCGKSVLLGKGNGGTTEFNYNYGDIYFQRYDCLKTYPYTPDDINQVVEIGSFMLETYINIDGRYDKNRGLLSNFHVTPKNFNLINPVYSQKDNFFTYKIQDEDFYKNLNYPNQVTWSKSKNNGEDIDPWTNITLANMLECDGDKGPVNKLIRFNNQLLCFQDKGLSQILYNENTQISTTEGVPIEIGNSEKVQGKRYLSDTVGCTNKWSITQSPNGIYFIDSYNKDILMFNGQLNSISQQGGFNSWCKQHIPSPNVKWTPEALDNFISHYDVLNQDILFVYHDAALAWSEKFNTFTSFYDYGDTHYFCNFNDGGLWLKSVNDTCSIWKHQTGKYCNFFDKNKPYWMVLVGNPEPTIDKIFTNLEFRASVVGDGEYDKITDRFSPTLPFDSMEVWNEYQHGYTTLENKHGLSSVQHHANNMSSALKRHYRIWRCDIPRNNTLLDYERKGKNMPYEFDSVLGVSRYTKKPLDRMRNPWVYLKLYKEEASGDTTIPKVEIHDIMMKYIM